MNDAYAAGFFDGEGTIQLNHAVRRLARNGREYHRYEVWLSVTQYDRSVLDLLAARYGGKVYQRKSRATGDGRLHWRFDWVITALAAAKFLRVIRPHMYVKAEEADIALQFADTMMTATQGKRNGIDIEVHLLRRKLVKDIRAVRERRKTDAYSCVEEGGHSEPASNV
jgi:hypothetical protein